MAKKMTWNKGLRKLALKKRRRRLPFTKRQAKAIKKLAVSTTELKEYTTSFSDASVVQKNIQLFTYANIVQGDGDGERIGDEINVRDLDIRFSMKSGTASCVGIIYIIEQLGDEDNFYTDFNTNFTDINTYLPNYQTAGERYKVHVARKFSINSVNMPDRQFRFKIKPIIKKINYPATTGLPHDKGKLFMLIATNNSTATQITLEGNYRYRYYD